MTETGQNHGSITTEVFYSTLYKGEENKRPSLTHLNYNKEEIYKLS